MFIYPIYGLNPYILYTKIEELSIYSKPSIKQASTDYLSRASVVQIHRKIDSVQGVLFAIIPA